MAAITEHHLALEVPATSCPDIIRIWDASAYAENLAVECETLEILVPGYADPVIFKNESQFDAYVYEQFSTTHPDTTAADATALTATTATFALTDYTDVVVGQAISGTGIPPGSIITNVNSPTDITITFPVPTTAPVVADFNDVQDLMIYNLIENDNVYAISGNPFMKNFDIRFTAADLAIQAQFPETLTCLPDGLYILRYSVNPNDTKYVKYYHLRTTRAMNTYLKELCKIQLAQCEPTAELKQRIADLRYIRMLLDAAKAKAEFCHAPDQAQDMLNYANKLMKKFQEGCCVTCS
jgi:hypothetical protein